MASFLDTYHNLSAPMYSFEGFEESDKDEMRGAFRKMAQGATLESSDEIEAKLRSIFGEKTYKENYDEIHENMDMFEDKYPVADNMSYLTGMASTAAVGLTPKMIQLASKLSPTKLGALVGLFEGTMSSEPGLSNRAFGGAFGTILGSTAGKALEKVSPGVLNLLNKFKKEAPPSVLPPETMSDSIQAIRDSAEKLKSKKKIKLNPIKRNNALSESTQDVINSLYFSPDHLRNVLDKDKDYARDYLTDLLEGDLTPDRFGNFQESLTKDPVPEELFNNVKKELYNQTQAFLNLNKYSDVIDVYRIGDISKGEIQSFTLNPRFSGESLPWAKDKTLKKYKVNKKDILGSTDIKDPWMEQEILINSDSLKPDDLTDSIKALQDSAKKLNFRS